MLPLLFTIRRRMPALLVGLALLAGAVAVMGAVTSARAQAQTLLRDPDIEHSLNTLARPILQAAGLSPARIKIMVVNDDSLNAFVLDGRAIFLNAGLILRLKTAGQVQAVIAHEAGHIANGHITRRLGNMRSARTAAGLGLLLSAAVGALAGGQAAFGVAFGTQETARRIFLSHTRGEESAADQSSARFMARAGVDPHAMVQVLEMFRGQEALSVGQQDPYMLSHPLTRDRLRAARAYASAYRPTGKPDARATYWFARARGKLGAFLRGLSWSLREARTAPAPDIALMMRAIAWHRIPKPAKAIAAVKKLVAQKPNDPYYQELAGQIELESHKLPAAVAAYGRAVALAPSNALIGAGYGRALLARNTAASNKKALSVLIKARARDPADARLLRDLGLAYARAGQNGMAALSGAERLALQGHLADAGVLAKRAAGLLPHGSPGWNRAQDVLRAARQFTKRRKRK